MEKTNKVLWYDKTWFFWILLIIVPYVGIPFMWVRKKHFSIGKKIILSVIFGLLAIAIITSSFSGGELPNNNLDGQEQTETTPPIDSQNYVTIIDFSSMELNEIEVWAKANKIVCNFEYDHSDTIAKGLFLKQSKTIDDKILEGKKITVTYSLGKAPNIEFKNALKKAKTYSDLMHMSKISIYNQLISEYGEDFEPEAAQYAIDNIVANWNENALAKAENYSDTMHMSKKSIYDQLISEYGEQFTAAEAQYAVDNIVADWNENALAKAKNYSDTMSMSKNSIYDQLISEYGEKFTAEEAQYAIDNLA